MIFTHRFGVEVIITNNVPEVRQTEATDLSGDVSFFTERKLAELVSHQPSIEHAVFSLLEPLGFTTEDNFPDLTGIESDAVY